MNQLLGGGPGNSQEVAEDSVKAWEVNYWHTTEKFRVNVLKTVEKAQRFD